jgi:hypothetical protein
VRRGSFGPIVLDLPPPGQLPQPGHGSLGRDEVRDVALQFHQHRDVPREHIRREVHVPLGPQGVVVLADAEPDDEVGSHQQIARELHHPVQDVVREPLGILPTPDLDRAEHEAPCLLDVDHGPRDGGELLQQVLVPTGLGQMPPGLAGRHLPRSPRSIPCVGRP